MTKLKTSFMGAVMKAIACTPNRNFDNESYTRGVIEPTRKIRQLMEELKEETPSQDQIKDVLTMLLKIFETKKVDMEEREDRINEILNANNLMESFSDILPIT